MQTAKTSRPPFKRLSQRLLRVSVRRWAACLGSASSAGPSYRAMTRRGCCRRSLHSSGSPWAHGPPSSRLACPGSRRSSLRTAGRGRRCSTCCLGVRTATMAWGKTSTQGWTCRRGGRSTPLWAMCTLLWRVAPLTRRRPSRPWRGAPAWCLSSEQVAPAQAASASLPLPLSAPTSSMRPSGRFSAAMRCRWQRRPAPWWRSSRGSLHRRHQNRSRPPLLQVQSVPRPLQGCTI
mmetsp:Transcript_128645/g.320847  ORF Transcript_128645/g.320847 Transcript_128645/m.320847 type:complete len:234 (-) Transcript_128645:47-748(-)